MSTTNTDMQNTTKTQSSWVRILFYSTCDTSWGSLGHIINNTVTSWDGPYCHVEMEFPNGQSVSIRMGNTVAMLNRSFDPAFYKGLIIESEVNKVNTAIKLANDTSQRQVKFGLMSGQGLHKNTTYCSKLVRDILIESEIVSPCFCDDYRFLLTPSAVFRALLEQRGVSYYTPNLGVQPISFMLVQTPDPDNAN